MLGSKWDFQDKGKSGWTGTSSFVLEVPLCNLRPSIMNSVPCDRIVQRAYCYRLAPAALETSHIVFMVAKLGNICFGRKFVPGSKNVFDQRQNHFFCFRAAKFVSATRINWKTFASATINFSATMFPRFG